MVFSLIKWNISFTLILVICYFYAFCPPGFPNWCDKERVPELYKMVRAIVTTNDLHAPDTSLLFPIFMSSGLPSELLCQIWESVNESASGQLTIEEMHAALALIAVAQVCCYCNVFWKKINIYIMFIFGLKKTVFALILNPADSSVLPLIYCDIQRKDWSSNQNKFYWICGGHKLNLLYVMWKNSD